MQAGSAVTQTAQLTALTRSAACTPPTVAPVDGQHARVRARDPDPEPAGPEARAANLSWRSVLIVYGGAVGLAQVERERAGSVRQFTSKPENTTAPPVPVFAPVGVTSRGRRARERPGDHGDGGEDGQDSARGVRPPRVARTPPGWCSRSARAARANGQAAAPDEAAGEGARRPLRVPAGTSSSSRATRRQLDSPTCSSRRSGTWCGCAPLDRVSACPDPALNRRRAPASCCCRGRDHAARDRRVARRRPGHGDPAAQPRERQRRHVAHRSCPWR